MIIIKSIYNPSLIIENNLVVICIFYTQVCICSCRSYPLKYVKEGLINNTTCTIKQRIIVECYISSSILSDGKLQYLNECTMQFSQWLHVFSLHLLLCKPITDQIMPLTLPESLVTALEALALSLDNQFLGHQAGQTTMQKTLWSSTLASTYLSHTHK